MLRIKSSELFGDGELKTRFYVVARKGCPSDSFGNPLPYGTAGATPAVVVFENQAYAEQFLEGFCTEGIYEDPKRWEVLSSDIYGGSLQMLQGASDFYSYVLLNPIWNSDPFTPYEAIKINAFVYLISAQERNVSVDELNPEIFLGGDK